MIVMVRRYRRKQRYDFSLQELPAATNNAEAVAAAAKAKVLYDDDTYTNPVYSSEFISPVVHEDVDKNLYGVPCQADAKN